MKIFTGEADLINYLKTQDLETCGVSMSPEGTILKDGWKVGPYHIGGYLYIRETLEFPVGERFRVRVSWSEEEDCWKSIKRVRQAIGER